jgi:hypothetical protein
MSSLSTPTKRRNKKVTDAIKPSTPDKNNRLPKNDKPSDVADSPKFSKSTPSRRKNFSPKKNERGKNVNDDITNTNDAKSIKSSSIFIPPRVNKIYKIVRKYTGALGGNGYDGAIYGELTVGSMQRVLNILVDECEMTSHSRFIDVGSGLGKPNFHASQFPKARLSVGVELEEIRWKVLFILIEYICIYIFLACDISWLCIILKW